jgi:hypothetical protein
MSLKSRNRGVLGKEKYIWAKENVYWEERRSSILKQNFEDYNIMYFETEGVHTSLKN